MDRQTLPRKAALVALLFALSGLPVFGSPTELTTQEKRLVAFVEKAANAYHTKALTPEAEKQLLAEFSDPKGPWVSGELYLYVYHRDGVCVAHGYRKDLIGLNLLGLEDSDGVFMIRDILEGLKGADQWWQNFRFPNPVKNNKVSPKRSFNRLVTSPVHPEGLLIGSGYYLGDK